LKNLVLGDPPAKINEKKKNIHGTKIFKENGTNEF